MPTPSSSDFHVGMASSPDRVCVKFVGGNRRVAHFGCGCPRLCAQRNALWTTLDKLDSRPLKQKKIFEAWSGPIDVSASCYKKRCMVSLIKASGLNEKLRSSVALHARADRLSSYIFSAPTLFYTLPFPQCRVANWTVTMVSVPAFHLFFLFSISTDDIIIQ